MSGFRASRGGLTRGLSALVVLLAAVCVASWLVVAGVHARDTYLVHQVSGVWLALAHDAEHGRLYPPLYDGDAFGGTRYMPAQIALYAGAAKMTGDPILGAKLVVYALAALLLALLYLALRQAGCPVAVAIGLASVALVTGVGLLAFTAVGGDTLPVLLQLGALVLVSRIPGRRAVAGAGALCALAILAKFTALWAPAALLVWLATRRDRRGAAAFGGTFALVLLAGLGLTEAISRGRFSDNLLAVSTSSFTGVQDVLLDSPGKLLSLTIAHSIPLVIVVPLVFVSLALAVGERRIGLYHLAFAFAVVIVLVVLTDPGSFYNHLLDVTVLALVVAGDLWSRTASGGELRIVFLAALVWALALGFYTTLKPETAEAARLLLGRTDSRAYAKRPPAGAIRPGDRILSDDPYVPLSVGQRPVVVDPFALIRLLRQHPDWERALIGRLDARQFDEVVLLRPLDDAGWWRDIHLGAPVVEAVRRNYRLEQHLKTWRDVWIYVPG